MHKKGKIVIGLFTAVLLITACTPKVEQAAPAAEISDPALVMSGKADAGWSLEDLTSLPSTDSDYINKDGETTSYSGVSFADLFQSTGVESYTSITLVAADDYTVDIDQATLDGCADCIISIQDDESLKAVLPGMSSALQVKYLVEIVVE